MSLLKKLRSKRGETLVEILVSIAILGLSIAFMITLVMTSYALDRQARAEDDAYYYDVAAAENYTVYDGIGKVKITRTDTPEITVSVDIYSNSGSGSNLKVKSYKRRKSTIFLLGRSAQCLKN